METYWTDAEIEDAFRQQESVTSSWPLVDILDVEGESLTWKRSLNDEALRTFLSTAPKVPLRIFFLKTVRVVDDSGRRDYLNPFTLRTLRNNGTLSKQFIRRMAQAGGWTRLGEIYFLHETDDGKPKFFDMCYEYGWVSESLGTGPFLTDSSTMLKQIKKGNQTELTMRTTYVCLNYPDIAMNRFMDLSWSGSYHPGAFFLDRLAADACIRALCQTVGTGHRSLRKYERHMNNLSVEDLANATNEIHRLSRAFATAHTNCIELEYLLLYFQACQKNIASVVEVPPRAYRAYERRLREQLSSCRTTLRWIESYERRIQVQINLLLHRSNQLDARANVALAMQSKEIAEYTAKLAHQTSRDSASMITIAAVTMFFLPATFVSSLFSTGFFDFDHSSIALSHKWWIYWVAVIPLTIGVFGVWLAWLRWRMSTNKQGILKQ